MIISGCPCRTCRRSRRTWYLPNVYVQGSSLAIGLTVWQFPLASNLTSWNLFAAFLSVFLQVGAPWCECYTSTISELVSIVTASLSFFVSVHYIIERFVKPRKQLKGGHDVDYNNVITLMVSLMLIYAAPLIFTSIGGVSERGGVVNVGLEGIMVMGAFS